MMMLCLTRVRAFVHSQTAHQEQTEVCFYSTYDSLLMTFLVSVCEDDKHAMYIYQQILNKSKAKVSGPHHECVCTTVEPVNDDHIELVVIDRWSQIHVKRNADSSSWSFQHYFDLYKDTTYHSIVFFYGRLKQGFLYISLRYLN